MMTSDSEHDQSPQGGSSNHPPRRSLPKLPLWVFLIILASVGTYLTTLFRMESSWMNWYKESKTAVEKTNAPSEDEPSMDRLEQTTPITQLKLPPSKALNSSQSKIQIANPSDKSTSDTKTESKPKIPTNTSSPGLHVCTCLTNNNPTTTILPPPPTRLRWLHFPKTGTSFISTLWSYACSTRERYIDLKIHSHQCNKFDTSAFSMYDFALMKRYPWEVYCAQNFIPSGLEGPVSPDVPLGLVAGTQHQPLTLSMKDPVLAATPRFQRLKEKRQLRQWGGELELNMTVAAFFRQPEQRIISAYYDSRHANGFTKDIYADLVNNTFKNNHCTYAGVTYKNQLECFARFKGIAGCMARMLTGEKCADGIFFESGMLNVAEAVDIIMNQLEFVGLTEDWNESICQFHRLFGGKLDGSTGERHWNPPLQGEFSNVHKSSKKKELGLEDLHGFTDVADTVVYEAAKLKFERIVGGNRCYKYMTWDELDVMTKDYNAETAAESVPFLRTDSDGKACKPKSCTDMGKQCGEWPDGCGSTVICGMCNGGRTGLPSTWRVQCFEGKCVDYCPTWHEKGYWFTSDMSKPEAPELLQRFASTIKTREQQYMTPAEAVSFCDKVCSQEKQSKNMSKDMAFLIDDGLCRCGKTPAEIKNKHEYTPEDFSEAHDLMTACNTAKARKFALAEDETQPKCCPKFDRFSPVPNGWKKLFIMGGPNLEGEYFEQLRLECGLLKECEQVARQKGAEMAVFDIYNDMCYLARNVVDLGGSYTVTKDNQFRYSIDLREKKS